MTHDIKLYQIAYNAETLEQVHSSGFLVLDNLGNPRPDWYEYWPIRNFLLTQTLDESAFYGFFSPKFTYKTQMTHADVCAFIRAANAKSPIDVALFSPQPDMGAHFLNVFEQAELFDPGCLHVAKDFLRLQGLDVPLESIVMDSRQTVFSNYFVARPAFWRPWFALTEALFAMAEDPAHPLSAALNFNTTYGDYSYQGEVSYRPNVPLQVALVDLAFASFGPTLTRCHDANLGCAGASSTIGFNEAGDYVVYDDNNFVDANGNNPFADTVNLVVGAAPGSARSFPNFISPYRGIAVGENAPNSYIRGWIPGKVAQYNLGATRVLGASENWIGADQVILIYELAATHVLNMPDFDELQIEGPFTATTHASAGADGSGADGSRLACSTNPSCSVGPDGLRFNPFQARRDSFADAFSWGYRIVGRIGYESVLPGISIQPLFIWQQDIQGNSPGPAGNFVEGRKQLNLLLETRYDKSFAFTIAYNAFLGGGQDNLYRDRDNLGFFVKYQF